MKNVNKKIEFYKRMREYFKNKSFEHYKEANFRHLLSLCGASNCFVVLGHDIASGVLEIIGNFADDKVYRLQKKQEKSKFKK